MFELKLSNELNQYFAYNILREFGRVDEAAINFTFSSDRIYQTCFFEAVGLSKEISPEDQSVRLKTLARVFEKFYVNPPPTVDGEFARLITSCFYWIAGYTANAHVLFKDSTKNYQDSLATVLLSSIFSQKTIEGDTELFKELNSFLLQGDGNALNRIQEMIQDQLEGALKNGPATIYIEWELIQLIIRKLSRVSFWNSVRDSSAPKDFWISFISNHAQSGKIIWDLWPSQRRAISKGALDGRSSLVIRMPTSAGKTKLSELILLNDLVTHGRRCAYIAPFRALVSEVESTIGTTISRNGFPCISLYGGSEANDLEVRLAEISKMVITTPEKILAINKVSGAKLSDFQTIVLDEGHLLDSKSRGASFELQLSQLRDELQGAGRVIFISAVLPNSDEIAQWLGGSVETLAESNWQPTQMRVGVIDWPKDGSARLTYLQQNGQPLTDRFFVPRLIEEDRWLEVNPDSGRPRKHVFPKRSDNGEVALAYSFGVARTGPVIIYTRRVDWANSIAEKALRRINLSKEIETNLIDERNSKELRNLADYMSLSLGEDSILAKSAAQGIGLHHSGVPQHIRLVIEEEYRNQTLRLLVATNTIAQGVNFPAKTVVVHSLPQTDAPIRDFWNLAGRAGRALKETEGEVILIGSGSLKRATLSRFLTKTNIEPIQSCIFTLVKVLLDSYQEITRETLNSLLDTNDGPAISTISAIDSHLIELLAEDVEGLSETSLEAFVTNLLATHQARKNEVNAEYSSGIMRLVRLRAEYLMSTVPDQSNRQRYAKSGVSAQTAILFDSQCEALARIARTETKLTPKALSEVLGLITSAPELRDLPEIDITALAYEWIVSGNYPQVWRLVPAYDFSLEDCVKFISEELTYRIPWMLNGLLRIYETSPFYVELPSWLENLAQYLRFGANSKELVWVMSLGIADRNIAEDILTFYDEQDNEVIDNFSQLVNWLLNNEVLILERVSSTWPSYFEKLLRSVIERYREISATLSQNGL